MFLRVPLVAYDHAIGAMAVYSDHERVRRRPLELLRVLASEASIAIEMPALQRRTHQSAALSLLNTISRNAIATSIREMLARYRATRAG